jgi:hypothetical protein
VDAILFEKMLNREITVKINGVDGSGTIVWHGASNSRNIVWEESTGPNRGTQHTTTITQQMIEEMEIISSDLVLVHPREM